MLEDIRIPDKLELTTSTRLGPVLSKKIHISLVTMHPDYQI